MSRTKPEGDLLVRLGGGEPTALEGLPQDRRYYRAVGMSLVVPLMLGIIGISVALHVVGDRKPIDPMILAVSVVWGLMIVIIDRLLLTAKPPEKAPPGSKIGSRALATFKRGIFAVMRILLALFIAVVVAEPFIAVGFGDEAVKEAQDRSELAVKADKEDTNEEFDAKVATAETQVAARRTDIDEEIERLQGEIATARLTAEARRNECTEELVTGNGERAQEKCPVADRAEEDRDEVIRVNGEAITALQGEGAGLDDGIGVIEDDRTAALKADEEAKVTLDDLGLWARIELVHHILPLWFRASLAGLLMLADSLPVLAKSLGGSRKAESIVDRRGEEAMAHVDHDADLAGLERTTELRNRNHDVEVDFEIRRLQAEAQLKLARIELDADTTEAAIRAETKVAFARFESERIRAGWGRDQVDDEGDDEDDGDESGWAGGGSANGDGAHGDGAHQGGGRHAADGSDGDGDGSGGLKVEEDQQGAGAEDHASPELLHVRNRAFEVGDEVGAGGQGVVHRGSVVKDNHRDPAWVARSGVAIKRPHEGHTRSFMEEVRFYEQYGEMISSVPGVLTSQEGTNPALVMRYFPNLSVDKFLFEGPIGARTVRHTVPAWLLFAWSRNIADNLAEVWKEFQAHGDGKPSNLLVCGEVGDPLFDFNYPYKRGNAGTLILCDFSTVGQFGDEPKALTPAYAPPEYLRGGGLSPFGDVYQYLGTTMWEVATGAPPPVVSPADTRPLLSVVNPRVPVSFSNLVASWTHPEPTVRIPATQDVDGRHVHQELVRQIDTAYQQCARDGQITRQVIVKGERV